MNEFINLLDTEINALSEAEESHDTKVAMVIMDGLLDIMNFVSDHDFDLAMQRMISLWENFFLGGSL